jgi:membrane associated rhomboid family serine protease
MKMIEFILNSKITFLIIGLWLAMYILNLKGTISKRFCGQGIVYIIKSKEYYRLLTGGLLHINLIHFIANASTLFWIGTFLERKIGHGNFISYYILGSLVSSLVFYCTYSKAQSGMGGSDSIFSLIGLILVLQLRNTGQFHFELGTWYGKWIVLYAILANIPFLKFMNSSTVVAHIIGYMSGIKIALSFIFFKGLL